jgi:hypothetical protein
LSYEGGDPLSYEGGDPLSYEGGDPLSYEGGEQSVAAPASAAGATLAAAAKRRTDEVAARLRLPHVLFRLWYSPQRRRDSRYDGELA